VYCYLLFNSGGWSDVGTDLIDSEDGMIDCRLFVGAVMYDSSGEQGA